MMYHISTVLATSQRILRQLSHDHRSVALIFLMPVILMSLLWWLYSDNDAVFDRIAPALLGIFPFTIMFLITSITTLRERTNGTFERMLVTPIAKLDIILGYTLAFGLLAVVQSLIASSVAIFFLDMNVAGPEWFVVLIALLNALVGTALGVFVSAFAQTEFQAVQFMPALIFPQFLVCGLLLPLDQMPELLESIAYYLPLTYAVDALQRVVSETDLSNEAWRDVWVLGAFILAAIVLGAASLRRRVK
ncbi:TPA: antibiotic ABC transporter permease [Candidatus Saccharibacteria bacterium]|nr:antibiotic ABC transporter permease [Candidatus Saccharibacteria bacterium]HRJ90848.1 ABC transporter permease [Candidatus Saccharibacteria bacterium]